MKKFLALTACCLVLVSMGLAMTPLTSGKKVNAASSSAAMLTPLAQVDVSGCHNQAFNNTTCAATNRSIEQADAIVVATMSNGPGAPSGAGTVSMTQRITAYNEPAFISATRSAVNKRPIHVDLATNTPTMYPGPGASDRFQVASMTALLPATMDGQGGYPCLIVTSRPEFASLVSSSVIEQKVAV
jgi:hypothetical protein